MMSRPLPSPLPLARTAIGLVFALCALGLSTQASAAPSAQASQAAPQVDGALGSPEQPVGTSSSALGPIVETFIAQVFEPLADQGGTPPTITAGTPRNDRLADCDDPAAFLPPGARLRSGMNVGVRCTVPQVWTTYVPVSIQMDVTYLVAARSIAADQPIGPDDIEARLVDLGRLPAQAVRQASELEGMVATNRINAGSVFKTSALRSPLSVVRGQQVRIVANGNGFSVSSEGQAMATAGPGSTVQVRTKSGQMVSGVVRHAGLVEITL